MVDWVGPTITAVGVIVVALIGAWVTLRYRRWAENRKREMAERELQERRRVQELRRQQAERDAEQRRKEFEWQQAKDVAKGVAWVVDRVFKDEDEDDEGEND